MITCLLALGAMVGYYQVYITEWWGWCSSHGVVHWTGSVWGRYRAVRLWIRRFGNFRQNGQSFCHVMAFVVGHFKWGFIDCPFSMIVSNDASFGQRMYASRMSVQKRTKASAWLSSSSGCGNCAELGPALLVSISDVRLADDWDDVNKTWSKKCWSYLRLLSQFVPHSLYLVEQVANCSQWPDFRRLQHHKSGTVIIANRELFVLYAPVG